MKLHILLLCFILTSTAVAQPPYEPISIWEREGAGDSSIYGQQILALGDQNDDSLNDWAVYAHGWGPPGQINEPRVEFFHGGNPPSTEPYMVILTQTPEEEYIWGARTLGDLNRDGYIDWTVTVALSNDPLDQNAYKIYFGGPGAHEEPDLIWIVPVLSGFFGVGDFNGDHFDDLYRFNDDYPDEWGKIYFGGDPFDTLPDWHRTADLAPAHPGDLNGDGFDDIVAYNNGTGYANIYLGAATPDTIPADSFPSISLDIIRDVNGDSFDDLCFRGNGWGGLSWGGADLDLVAEAQLAFPCGGSGPLSRRILSASDFNHDGFNDVVMLRDWCSDSWYGVLTLHLGHPWVYSEPAFVIYGWTEPLNLIHIKTAVGLGDVNGDGIDDLAIGANGTPEQAAYRGKAVVIRGDDSLIVDSPEPPRPLPDKLEVQVYPNPFNSTTMIKFSIPAYSATAELIIFNLLGQEVFEEKIFPTGSRFSYHYNATDLSTGLYLLRVSSGNLQTTTKLMVLK